MAKTSPAAGAEKVRKTSAFDDWKKDLQHNTERDRQDMQTWLERKKRFYNRRYSRYGKSFTDGRPRVNSPWPGAANHNIPLSDISIDELHGPLLNLIDNTRRIVAMVPMNTAAIANAEKAGIAMEYLLRYRMSEAGSPDHLRQCSFSIDSLLQHGLSIDKTYYSYVTSYTSQRYDRRTLPEDLQRVQVVADEDFPGEETRQAIAQQTGALVIARSEFAQLAPQIESLVTRVFGLDLQERADREALSKAMAYIKANNPEAELQFAIHAIVEDCPRIINVPIEDLVVPPGTRMLETASRLTHETYFSQAAFIQAASNNNWDDDAVNEILDDAPRSRRSARFSNEDSLWQALRSRTGTHAASTDSDEQQIRVSQTFAQMTNGKSLPMPVVLTWERDSGAILDAAHYEYGHRSWPFVDTRFEYNDSDYFSSRGIPDKIEDLERYVTALARHEMNGLTIETSKTFTYRPGSGFDPNKHKWVPGIFMPRQRPDDIQPLDVRVSSMAVERPMFQMMSLAERLVGSRQNTTVRDARLFEPPTKADISERAQQFESALGMRALFFQHGRERIYRQAWALWRQYGPAEFYAHVTGEPLARMSQSQIAGEFQTVPTGVIGDMNPGARLQKELTKLDVLVKATPFVRQDVRYVDDIPVTIKQILDLIDPHSSDRILRLRSQEEQQQILQQRQAEVQRLQQLKATAMSLQDGSPVTEASAAELLKEIRTITPHKALQPIIQMADQAQSALENSMSTMVAQ